MKYFVILYKFKGDFNYIYFFRIGRVEIFLIFELLRNSVGWLIFVWFSWYGMVRSFRDNMFFSVRFFFRVFELQILEINFQDGYSFRR